MNRFLMAGAVAVVAAGAFSTAQAAPVCTPTGYMVDATNLTAASINPSGTVSGEVDATGCDIGIYFSSGVHVVQNADVHSARYFGIVNNGANVGMFNNTVHDIGDVPLDGAQHGRAIFVAPQGAGSGNIIANTIWNYQKSGIEVRGPLAHDINIQWNVIEGQGPVDFIASNGVEIGYNAVHIQVQNNIITGNSYTGANDAYAAGVLIFGGDGNAGAIQTNVVVQNNSLIANDIGVAFSNIDSLGHSVTSPTKNQALNNTMWNNAVYNTTGSINPTGFPYQAGVSVQGHQDQVKDNNICGPGYTPVPTPPPYLFHIDVEDSTGTKVKGNNCNGSPVHGANATHQAKKSSP